ncbi:MAG: CBS domain-containing protein [Streptosporangiaceae bacterium]
MTHRTVREIMTTAVVTTTPDEPFKKLAALMIRRGISAVPVVDTGGRVLGVVSEIDLLRKEEYAPDGSAPPPPHWRHGPQRARAASLTAADAMTAPPVAIAPDATLVEAARVMDRHRLRHLLVLGDDGRLAGIVTPRDLLSVYLRPDAEVREEIICDVITGYLGTDPARVTVTVTDGRVTLGGEVEHKSMIPLAVERARGVDGVVDVTEHLSYATDDSHPPQLYATGEQPPGYFNW